MGVKKKLQKKGTQNGIVENAHVILQPEYKVILQLKISEATHSIGTITVDI